MVPSRSMARHQSSSTSLPGVAGEGVAVPLQQPAVGREPDVARLILQDAGDAPDALAVHFIHVHERVVVVAHQTIHVAEPEVAAAVLVDLSQVLAQLALDVEERVLVGVKCPVAGCLGQRRRRTVPRSGFPPEQANNSNRAHTIPAWRQGRCGLVQQFR